MKKLLLLAFIGLGLCTQTIKAEIPDLSDWVPANTKLPEADRDLGRAAAVILLAKKGTDFTLGGKTYKVIFEEYGRQIFDDIIMAPIAHGQIPTIEALRNGTIELSRNGTMYRLTDLDSYEEAEFTIRTQEQLDASLKASVLDFSNMHGTVIRIRNSAHQEWADKAIRLIVNTTEDENPGINALKGSAYAAYLNRKTQTPEIVELIRSQQ